MERDKVRYTKINTDWGAFIKSLKKGYTMQNISQKMKEQVSEKCDQFSWHVSYMVSDCILKWIQYMFVFWGRLSEYFREWSSKIFRSLTLELQCFRNNMIRAYQNSILLNQQHKRLACLFLSVSWFTLSIICGISRVKTNSNHSSLISDSLLLVVFD